MNHCINLQSEIKTTQEQTKQFVVDSKLLTILYHATEEQPNL